MNDGATPAGPAVRIGFAFIGLVAGVAAQLLFLFMNAVAWALWKHPAGAQKEETVMWLGVATIGTVAFSLAGWALLGVPLALAFPAQRVARMPWPLWFVAGPLLGIIALLLISLAIHVWDSQPGAEAFRMAKIIWPQTVIVSTVAFGVYAVLLRRRLGRS